MRKELLNKANLAWLLLSIVSFVVLSILMKVGIIGSYYSITLYNIFINIILAVSLNLVIGVCGQFSLGHAGFMCIGAYCAGIMVKMMPNMTGLAIDWLCTFNHCSFDCLYSNIAFERGLFGNCDFGVCGNCTYPSAKYGNHKWSGRIKWNS